MSEFKGTKSPWWAGSDDDAHMVYSGDPIQAVADCGRDDGDYGAEEANARLIAAAPELLDVCEKIVDYRRRAGSIGFQLEKMDDFIHMAKVAIAKALEETT